MRIRTFISLIINEIKQYGKSFSLIMLVIIPIVCTFLLNNYINKEQEKEYYFAVTEETDQMVINTLKDCGEVKLFDNEDQVLNYIMSNKEYIGVNKDSVTLRNNLPNYMENYIKLLLKHNLDRSTVKITEIGVESTLYKYSIASFLFNLCILTCGMLFGISILREKLNGTYLELERFGIKSVRLNMTKLFLPVAVFFLSFKVIRYVFKLNIEFDIHLTEFYVMAIMAIFTFGYILGNLPRNQTTSLIYFSAVFVLFSITVFSMLFKKFSLIRFISSFYWSFMSIYNILNEESVAFISGSMLFFLQSTIYILFVKIINVKSLQSLD